MSSSGVREALAGGDFALAERRLGRPYSMRGRVVSRPAARTGPGFPDREFAQSSGGECRCRGFSPSACMASQATPLPGVASLGTRPTVGGVQTLLEVHLFDFAADLYGREIEVEFVAKLRDEERFATLEALVAQIHRDAAQARRILNA